MATEDAKARKQLEIVKHVSLRSLENAIRILDANYVTSGDRELIVRLLKLAAENDPETRVKALGLASIFGRSTYSLRYIEVELRNEAKDVLRRLRSQLPDSSLEPMFSALTVSSKSSKTDENSLLTARFQQLLEGRSIASRVVDVFRRAQVFSFSINESVKKILVFGPLKDQEFWNIVEVHYRQLLTNNLSFLPPFEFFKNVVQYYGGLSEPFNQSEAAMAGTRFPFEMLDRFVKIPNKLNETSGTIGGYLKVGSSYYAVTAAHVVSSSEEILDDDFLYLGEWKSEPESESYFLDVAFLKIRDDADMPLLNPLCSLTWEAKDYTQYWSSYLNDNPGWLDPICNADSVPPGLEIQKVGFGSGFTSGRLIDARATVHRSQNLKTFQNVIAIRGSQRIGVVSVESLPDRAFTTANDSGSIYYAVFGCMRYPLAIHSGVASQYGFHLKGNPAQTNEAVSYGTRLREALDWWLKRHNAFGGAKIEWCYRNDGVPQTAVSDILVPLPEQDL